MDANFVSGTGRSELIEKLRAAQKENARLTAQVDDLQARMTAMVESSLARQVRAFHAKFGHPVATTPAVPDAEQVKFRLKLIAEEFFELLAACEIWPAAIFASDVRIADAQLTYEDEVCVADAVKYAIEHEFVDPNVVDLAKFTDALADLDYVIEGTRAVFGIHGKPIADAVHVANMAKESVLDEEDRPVPYSKPTKPKGWRTPDVRAFLIEQGWRCRKKPQ